MTCVTVEVGPTDVQGETRIRRSVHSTAGLVSSVRDDIKTLYDVIRYSARVRPNLQAMGYRKVIKLIEEEKEVTKMVGGEQVKEKKTWKYFKLSPYNWLTYRDVEVITLSIGSGLIKLGLKPKDKITVFGATSANWLLVSHGAFSQSMTIVTVYDTLGEEGLLHSMNEAEVCTAYTNADLLKSMSNVAGRCPTLKRIIYDGEAKAADVVAMKEKHPHLQLVTLEELKQLGMDFATDPTPPAADDLCCIMYTSGSTGNPKGVLLTHGNLIGAIGGVDKMLTKYVHEGDVLLAYLPLAHVLEFLVENLCLYWGITLGYGTIRTLTDSSVRECQGDIKELRPTLMTGVPAVWETIRKGVVAQVSQSSPLVQRLFNAALSAKGWCMDRKLGGPLTSIFDTLVFNKVRQQTGGRLRYALSGGAPISMETQRFLSTALCPILQAYGMTESCGMCAILTPEVFNYNRVGSPVPCVEVKLVDVAEAGYFATDEPNQRGEVWIRGPSISSGYFKNAEETTAALSSDGWLRTGDIGEWHEDGTLSIIDRKKNLVKLSHGEYIALEKLESVYKSTAYCNNICIYADSMQSKPIAIIVASEPRIMELAKSKGIEGDFATLCQDKVITKAVLDACLATAKRAGLKPAEMLQGVYLEHEEWTAVGGMLTAAQKLKRKEINVAYAEQIKVVYSS